MGVLVSFSELDTFRQCPHKHELSYKQRWQSPTTGPALVRGTLWHAVMEAHYGYLKEVQEANGFAFGWDRHVDIAELSARVDALLIPERGEQNEHQVLVEWMYQGYLDLYGFDAKWEVVAVEHNAVVTLPTARGTASQVKLKIKMDLILRDDRKRLWVVDHKSGKDLPKEKELDIDDQFGLYTWGMRKLGKPVFGSMHNAARTQRNKDPIKHPQLLEDRFSRTRLVRSDVELDTLAVEAWRAARRAYAIKPGEADRAPNSDTCRWRCDYTEACLAGRKGFDERQMLIDTGYVQDFTRH